MHDYVAHLSDARQQLAPLPRARLDLARPRTQREQQRFFVRAEEMA